MFKHRFSYYYFVFVLLLLATTLLVLPLVVSEGADPVRYAPGNHIAGYQIQVYQDKVVLDVEDAKWASFKDTDSMVPFFDAGAHALQFVPKSPLEITEGDIITYRRAGETVPVIHRVVYVGTDKEGTYYTVQGDNNAAPDPGKIRFSQVDSVVFAIIY
jgi:signal peptidase I